MNAYDVVRYPSRSYVQTHPNRLAALAALMGVPAAPPSACRVLEIGCGDGTNLLAMAVGLPGSRFVGVDLAATAIASARAAAVELGLEGVSFHERDVAEVTREAFGEFDYILAHGLFSWVGEPVRQRVLALCGELLAPGGVAYVSYNAYPGCHLREVGRNLMRYHVRHLDDPVEQVAQGRAVLRLLAESRRETDEAYHHVLTEARDHAREYNQAALFHDDLSAVNQPFYFHEFMDLAAAQGLQFLGEADLRDMHLGAEGAGGWLAELGARDVLVKEQYLDFLTGRRFRQTLLCRAGLSLERDPGPNALAGLHVAANVEPAAAPEGAEPGTDHYRGPKGAELTASHPVIRAAVARLSREWPQSLPLAELAAASGGAGDDRLARFLLKAAAGGVVELRAEAAPLVREPGPRPVASRFARWQARSTQAVTTLHHTRVWLDDPAIVALLRRMDGSRTREELAADLAGELAEPAAGLADSLEISLGRLARLGLLSA